MPSIPFAKPFLPPLADYQRRLKGIWDRVWLTNEHLHNGLRADGAGILDRLIAMARGRA